MGRNALGAMGLIINHEVIMSINFQNYAAIEANVFRHGVCCNFGIFLKGFLYLEGRRSDQTWRDENNVMFILMYI